MSALSSAAHNKPELVKDLLPTLLPLLYDQTVIKVHVLLSLVDISKSAISLFCVSNNV